MVNAIQTDLATFQREWQQKAKAAELPDRSQEEWRRINLRRLRLEEHSPAKVGVANIAGLEVDATKVTLHGHNEAVTTELPKGVTVTSLADSFSKSKVQELLSKVAQDAGHIFDYQILGSEIPGAVIEIADGTVLDKPLLIEQATTATSLFGLLFILIGDHVEAKIVDSVIFPSADSIGWLNDLHLLSIGKSSNIHYYSYNEIGSDNYGYQKLFTFLGGQSNLKTVQVTSGGFQVKQWQEHTLTESHANLRVLGCLAAGGREFNDFDARVTHLADETESSILYKTGLTDRAFALFTGNLIIPKETKNVKAEQLNRNLLMSDGARCESIPKLEVEPENVECAHGTSIGFLDKDRIFYLQARGLTRTQAERLLLEAFFAEILDEVTVEEVQSQIYEKISEKLGLGPKNV